MRAKLFPLSVSGFSGEGLILMSLWFREFQVLFGIECRAERQRKTSRIGFNKKSPEPMSIAVLVSICKVVERNT